ncbi:carbohydrate kinase family protein [Microbacterium sp. gxy059]|uniref:carbohydrate kinase family protein n=1 Tax=Microbacterium sp. gxy059 TaxID=2957199 RepID=UPI003D99B8AD
MTAPDGRAAHDVVLAGPTFFDLVMGDLDADPRPGTEVYASRMSASPGGIATLAVAAARLGLSTGLASTLGDDLHGRWCRHVLGDVEGVDLARTRVLPDWPTPVTVSIAHDGDRSMITREERADPVDPLPDGASARAAIADLAQLAGDAPDAWWRRASRQGTRIFADSGWDPTGAWSADRLRPLEHCWAFTPNEHEAIAYTGATSAREAARALAARVPLVVVTRGARGAFAVDAATGEEVDVPGLPVDARDATGAGDVFQAALVWAVLDELPLADAVAFAVLSSGIATTELGGATAAPCWGDIADARRTFPDDRFRFVDELVRRIPEPLHHRADRRTPFSRFAN